MLIPLLLAAALPAAAAPRGHELSAELSGLPTRDPSFELYTGQSMTRSWGLRGAYGFGEHLSLVGDLQLSRTGTLYALEDYELDVNTDAALVASLQTVWLGLGPKARLPLGKADRFAAYATVQGVGLFSASRLDDDPEVDDNPGQLTQRVSAVGLRGVLGAEWAMVQLGGVQAVLHFEAGYLGALPGKVRNHDSAPDADGKSPLLGDLQYGGAVVQSGVGVRF